MYKVTATEYGHDQINVTERSVYIEKRCPDRQNDHPPLEEVLFVQSYCKFSFSQEIFIFPDFLNHVTVSCGVVCVFVIIVNQCFYAVGTPTNKK